MPRSQYHEHIQRHVRGSSNPRAAFREAAAMWRGGATKANPGQGDMVTQVAIGAALLYLGVTWLMDKGGLGGILAAPTVTQQPQYGQQPLSCGCLGTCTCGPNGLGSQPNTTTTGNYNGGSF